MRALLTTTLATALSAATSLPAQGQPSAICQADFNTPAYNPAVSMGGPNLSLAIQLTAASSYAASRIEMFTGNQTGQNTVAIWSQDAALNQPLSPIGQGAWEMSRMVGWQGANLTPPVPLAQGQTFWLVWGPRNGAQASVEGNGQGAQPYRGSFTGGAQWNGPFVGHQWKLRIWCGSTGHYESFGSGCAGARRSTPELGWSGIPTVGQSFSVLLDRGTPNDFALLTLGDSNTMFSGGALPFSLAAVGAGGCFLRTSVTSTLFALTDPAGQASVTLNVPANPTLLGFAFFDQWFAHDLTANTLEFVVSNGGAGTVGL